MSDKTLKLIKESDALAERIESGRNQLDHDLQSATDALALPQSPASILLKIEDGRIVEICPD